MLCFLSAMKTRKGGELNPTALHRFTWAKLSEILFRGQRIAVVADKIVRAKNVGLLFSHQLADREGKILLESIRVSLLRLLFPLLGSLEQAMVAAAQLRL